MITGTIAEPRTLELLVVRVAAGDESAWRELWEQIEPLLLALVSRPRFIGRLGQREDDRRNIVVEVMARLRADGYRRLQRYVTTRTSNPTLEFERWLHVVVKRVAIDYLRTHPDYIDRRDDAGVRQAGHLVEAQTLPASSQLPGVRPPITDQSTAREILAHAASGMPDQQRWALELWTRGVSYDAIAQTVGAVTATEAERLVRAAVERLRRKFRDDKETP